jgi:hypothetical protein
MEAGRLAGACPQLIRPLPARGRHRNHSAARAPGARGNGPASRLSPLTQPPRALGRPAPSGSAVGWRRGAGCAARGRRRPGGPRGGA